MCAHNMEFQATLYSKLYTSSTEFEFKQRTIIHFGGSHEYRVTAVLTVNAFRCSGNKF